MIFDTAATNPNGLALDDLTRRRTWAELVDRSTRIAHLFRDGFGLRPDDHAALLLGNRVEAIELTLGAMLAGIWLTPINRHLQAEEIAYIVADSGARVVFTDDEHEVVARQSAAPEIVLVGDELDRALADVSDEPIPLSAPPGAAMIYTSGTTGRPKGVKRARQPTLDATLSAIGAAGDDARPRRQRPASDHRTDLPRGAAAVRALRSHQRRAARHHAALGRGADPGTHPGPADSPYAPGADDVRSPPQARRTASATPSIRRRCAWCCTARRPSPRR